MGGGRRRRARPAPLAANSGSYTIARNWPNSWRPRSPRGNRGSLRWSPDPGAVKIRKALNRANAIVESAVDDVTARDIKAAAKDAGVTKTADPPSDNSTSPT